MSMPFRNVVATNPRNRRLELVSMSSRVARQDRDAPDDLCAALPSSSTKPARSAAN